jgi:hypothetical protein
MVIKKILKQLTPEKIKKINTEVGTFELTPSLKRWVREYNKIGEGLRTTDYFWKWIFRTAKTITLPFTINKYRDSLFEIKTLLIMFVVLLDDVFDKTKETELGNALLKIPFEYININTEINNLKVNTKKYFQFTKKLWSYLEKKIQKYPKYKEYRKIFEFDIKQLLNEMEYSRLINENYFLANKTEFFAYFSHNMQAIIDVTLDLMCSHDFDIKILGTIREIAIEAQKMARIGNWVSTWEREVKEEDFTSEVFIEAINSKILGFEDLKKENELEIVEKIKKGHIENILFQYWENSYKEISAMGKKINQKPLVNEFLKNLEKLIIFHLSSRGYK